METRKFLVAEYNPHWIYHGWWLYERDHNDGRVNDGHRDWGWLKDGSPWSKQSRVRDLCVSMGYDPPQVLRCSQDFAEWFAATFPAGLRVAIVEKGYHLLEIVAKLPERRHRSIRTIRGANLSRSADRRRRARVAAGRF